MTNSIEPIQEKKPGKWGGARPNAGRKPGSKNHISVEDLLTSLTVRSGGQRYEDLLVEDFLTARNEGNKDTVIKYHNLILNKVMATMNSVEVSSPQDEVDAKQAAFTAALAKITEIAATTK